jgi:hypothetical protein
MMALFLVAGLGSYLGWGLTSDVAATARARSVRTGSLHQRHFFGGGPGFGK